MTGLTGRVVLITGAAQGIGAATARALAHEGARLVLTDVDEKALEALAAELGSEIAVSAVGDVRELDSLQEAVQVGIERFGGIDMVLANAGIASYGSVLAVDPEMFARVIDVNITGVFNTVRAALPSVIERRGYILIVSSLAAFAPSAGMAAYNASKAGVLMLADALRLELAHRGVEVGSAHMSWVDTPLVRDVKADLPSFSRMLATLPKPLARTTSVEACATAFVRGLAERRRRVYVPRWVGLLAWLRPLLSSAAGDRTALEHVPQLLTMMDAEVQGLGRSTSARNLGRETTRT